MTAAVSLCEEQPSHVQRTAFLSIFFSIFLMLIRTLPLAMYTCGGWITGGGSAIISKSLREFLPEECYVSEMKGMSLS